MAEVIVALDTPTAGDARRMVRELGDAAGFYKVGLELFTAAGPDVVSELVNGGKRVFLDLKLHDIPNTVAGAVRAASERGVELLTVHTAGGSAMLSAARDAAAARVRLLGVTVLTSLGGEDLQTVWGRPVESVPDEVGRLAELAVHTGLDGVVASAAEAQRIRRVSPAGFLVVVPGIRPGGVDRGDQKRVATPAQAVAAGADYLVVGRAVTAAEDPEAALRAILEEVQGAERAPA